MVLKAIAAQCLPIMKNHYLSVTTLEEYEPNPEFIGRNFNNGEIIQLVIKSRSGAWLPLNMIQMVMMHELAHNTHMNHGKGFWQARNLYADEMRGLWQKGYTGEGLWGQGRSLRITDEALGGSVLRSDQLGDLPLCGGTFRSRQKKRKIKGPDLTWKEKRDKRIERKFGKNGEKLGEDEDSRLNLEIGRKGPVGGKPRVAQSKRGRELRAAAALARFETNKTPVQKDEDDIKDEEETETESEYEETDVGQEDAKDAAGRRIVDKNGKAMIRVCQEENEDNLDVKKEMQELVDLNVISSFDDQSHSADTGGLEERNEDTRISKQQDEPRVGPDQVWKPETWAERTTNLQPFAEETSDAIPNKDAVVSKVGASDDTSHSSFDTRSVGECLVCSMVNDPLRLTCEVCANVLDPRKDARHWKCNSETCKDSAYINAGDCGVCGVCGGKKPSPAEESFKRQVRHLGKSSHSAHIAYL